MHPLDLFFRRSFQPPVSRRKSGSKPAPKSRGRWRTLALQSLEPRTLLSTVTWINPNGGAWDVGANWSNGQGPGAGDDALINVPVSSPITVQSGDNITVRSVTTTDLSDTLNITGGSLTVAGGTSLLGASLSVGGSSSLTAFGLGTSLAANGPSTTIQTATLEAMAGASLSVNGPATVNTANLEATGGGHLALPTMKNYSQPQGNYTWIAQDAGSALSFTGLQWLGIIAPWWNNWGLQVQALSGGSGQSARPWETSAARAKGWGSMPRGAAA